MHANLINSAQTGVHQGPSAPLANLNALAAISVTTFQALIQCMLLSPLGYPLKTSEQMLQGQQRY
jgi:hypothetical protein